MTRFLLLASLAAAFVWPHTSVAQEAVERILKVPVKVKDAYGKQIERDITVTVFEVPGKAPYPLLVFNHGRAVSDSDRAKFGRSRYSDASKWFASLGYSVWLPTRIGYGVSGADEDPEYTGLCNSKRYEPGFAAAADQVVQVIEYAKRDSNIDSRRIVVAGQSFGGMTTIAVAARNPPGLIAAINFAGGSGGNPAERPGNPCGAGLLEDLYEDYGKTSRAPTLWIYTENDRWMGSQYPKAWFGAFKKAGGVGEFVPHPANGEDGHSLFTKAPALWRPIVERFLVGIGEQK